MHKQEAIEAMENIIGYGDVLEGTLEGTLVMVSGLFIVKAIYEELPSEAIAGVTQIKVQHTKQEFTLLTEIERISVTSTKHPRINLHLKSGAESHVVVSGLEHVQSALEVIILQIGRATEK